MSDPKLQTLAKTEYLRLYKVRFPGCWMGGVAIVRADHPMTAKNIVFERLKEEAKTKRQLRVLSFDELEARKMDLEEDPIIYLDDGDY